MEVPNEGDWDGHFAKYICMVALNRWVYVGRGDVGPVYSGASLCVVNLWAWEPKEESDAGK